jgi:hypothetical protein
MNYILKFNATLAFIAPLPAVGVTMIKPTTSYFIFLFFFATTGFVVLLSPSKIIFLGVFPRFQKNPKIEMSWESCPEMPII